MWIHLTLTMTIRKERACVYFNFPFAIKLAIGLNAFQQMPSPHGRILLPDSLLNSFHQEGPQNSAINPDVSNNIMVISLSEACLVSESLLLRKVPSTWQCDLGSKSNILTTLVEKAWATIEELARYDVEGWNDPVVPEEASLYYENPDLEQVLGVMKCKVGHKEVKGKDNRRGEQDEKDREDNKIFDDDWGLESKEVSPLGEELSLFDRPNEIERCRILETHRLEPILQQQISECMAPSHHDGRKAHLLEDKQIPIVVVFDEVSFYTLFQGRLNPLNRAFYAKIGNSQVKDNKIDLLVQQYEQFTILEEESIDSGFARFNTIITSLKALDEVVMEKDSEIYRGKKERVKSISLKAKKESSDDETLTSGSDDEEYAMAVRNFKRYFRRKCKFFRQPREEKKSFQKRDEKKGKSERKCFRCGDPNHLIGDCPKPPRNKDQKAFIEGS
ncbi:zf-CCHC domain-containing protein [Tanacetum coccineum]